MHYAAVTPDQTLLVTLEYGADLAAEIEAAASEADLASAWVVGWGAVEDAELAYYDQDAFAMDAVAFEEPLSMPFVSGTVGRTAGDSSGENGGSSEKTETGSVGERATGSAEESSTGNAEDTATGSAEDTDAGGLRASLTGVFSRPSGQSLAGQVERATVFGGQVMVQGFEDELTYERDDATAMERLAP